MTHSALPPNWLAQVALGVCRDHVSMNIDQQHVRPAIHDPPCVYNQRANRDPSSIIDSASRSRGYIMTEKTVRSSETA